jgi:hypothetical protein
MPSKGLLPSLRQHPTPLRSGVFVRLERGGDDDTVGLERLFS